MHALDGPRLKIRRAESQIEALDSAESIFRKGSHYRIVREEVNPKTGNYVYRARVDRWPPAEWGVVVGEIAHNIVSALDNLVYQLALLNPKTKAPASNSQFPVFLHGTTTQKRRGRKDLLPHFEGMRLGDGRSMIRDLKPEHQAVIERLQPYKRGNEGRRNRLWRLKQLNNADKHRLLQVAGAMPLIWSGGRVGLPRADFGRVRVLEDGATIGEAHPEVIVNPHVFPLVAFWEGCDAVRDLPVVSFLRNTLREAAEVVEGFGPEFG